MTKGGLVEYGLARFDSAVSYFHIVPICGHTEQDNAMVTARFHEMKAICYRLLQKRVGVARAGKQAGRESIAVSGGMEGYLSVALRMSVRRREGTRAAKGG